MLKYSWINLIQNLLIMHVKVELFSNARGIIRLQLPLESSQTRYTNILITRMQLVIVDVTYKLSITTVRYISNVKIKTMRQRLRLIY